jgi:hypothetical protein
MSIIKPLSANRAERGKKRKGGEGRGEEGWYFVFNSVQFIERRGNERFKEISKNNYPLIINTMRELAQVVVYEGACWEFQGMLGWRQ